MVSLSENTRTAESVITLFRDVARIRPNASAIVTSDDDITYAQLLVRTDEILGTLRRNGVLAGDLVGIACGRTTDCIATILAIFAAGAAYVPLDPSYPHARLGAMIADARPRLIVTDAAHASTLGTAFGATLVLDGMERSDERGWEPAGPDDLAYVIYTSGSTGAPKGVEIAMKSVVSLIAWARVAFSAEERAGIFCATSISFDVSVFEIFAALCTGGTIVLGSDILEARTHEARGRIRMVCGTTSGLAALVETRAIPPTVTTVLQAGERLGGVLARELLATSRVRRLLNLCGATEDTVYSVAHEVDPEAAGDPPIGRPILGRSAYVCNRTATELVPDGTVGELCYAGSGIARGYRGMPARTAERFVTNPFASGADDRVLYRSGDRARVNAAGELEHLGRLDDQVKVRGYRVELGDVERAYSDYAGIREVVVVPHTAPAGDVRLAAYAVPRAGALDLADVQRAVAAKLPAWMVPAALVQVTAFARTPSGKLDRTGLPEPVWGQTPSAIPPTTPTESAVAEIWANVLGIAHVGRDDDFFQLGGNSLAAARVSARVEERYHIARMLGPLFADARLHAFSAAVDRERAIDRPYDPVVVVGEAMDDRPPLFWFHGHYNGNESYVRRALDHLPAGYGLISIAPHDGANEPVPESIEAMARERYARLREMQPYGPYRLGGFCNGGLVAYHIATMLVAEGETVSTLLLLSTSVFRERTSRLLARISPRLYAGATRLALAFERSAATRAAQRNGPEPTPLDHLFATIIRAYRPPAYAGPMTVVWGAESREEGYLQADLGWHRYAPNATIVRVPGVHDSVRRSATAFGALLRAYAA